MVQLLTSLNRIKERGNELTEQAVERGGELLERGKGSELVNARGRRRSS